MLSVSGMFVFALPLTAAMSTATARATLLDIISPLNRGFKADQQQRRAVEVAIKELAASTYLKELPDISGDWELIYTDAPDILGLDMQAGPLATCTRIGQQISEAEGTMLVTMAELAARATTHAPRTWMLAESCASGPRGEPSPRECRREAVAALWCLPTLAHSAARHDLQRDRVWPSRVGGVAHRPGKG